jgi:nitrate reductase delta subunit
MHRDRHLLEAFADLLGYPGPSTAERARSCAARLAASGATGAAERLARFAEACEARGPAGLEELYTTGFDLGPACIPYVGHHLFGEGRERALFLARLRAMQREEGVVAGSELPDHVSEVLRFLARARDAADRDALLEEGLVPAAEKMLATLDEARHPWADVVGGLLEVVRSRAAATPRPAALQEVMP